MKTKERQSVQTQAFDKQSGTPTGEIPEGWEENFFSEVVDVNPKRELRKEAVSKFVSMAGLKEFNKKIQRFTVRKFSSGSKFINGDTLMARITPCLENGKTAFVDILENGEVGCGSTEFIVLCGKDGKSTSQFVYYLTTSPHIREKAIKSMIGTSGRQRVESNVFEKLIVNLPTLAEQHAIAKILSDLDEKIELNHRMNKTLEAIAQAIFKRWFIDFNFPNEKGPPYKDSGGRMVDSEPGEIPVGWAIQQISDCGEVICGKTPPTADKDNYGDDIFFITIPDMRDQAFVIQTERKLSQKGSSLQKKKELPPFAICVSCIATPGLVSLTSDVSHTNQQINSIVCKKDFSPYFMYCTMLGASEEVKSMGLGGTATLNLNAGDFSRMKVLVPDYSTMNLFHENVGPLMARVLENSRENMNLSQIRDSLLPKLMSGRIRVGSENLK
ncbi:MAG: restriction endonuclease subunit S [Candidatus Omnitrophica bacterium]|nr:restriction endonuclease subunit S [Candidatus Omnitrophota bacterium]